MHRHEQINRLYILRYFVITYQENAPPMPVSDNYEIFKTFIFKIITFLGENKTSYI